MSDKMVSVTLKFPESTYNNFVKASEIIARTGIQIQKNQVLQMMLAGELEKLDPAKLAKRFKQCLIKSLTKSSELIDGDEEDEDFSASEQKLESVSTQA